MATAAPVEEDNFKLELSRVREKVITKFLELTECLNERKNELLRQLDEILSGYESYRNEFVRVNEKKKALERSKSLNESELCNSPVCSGEYLTSHQHRTEINESSQTAEYG